MGAFVSKKSIASFFASTMARTALAGGFRTSFVNRNQNFENTPNMSFGSNEVDWVRSFRENQLQVFLVHTWPERPVGAGFARGLSIETKTAKTHQTRILGQTGWIGCVHFKKLNIKFFHFNGGQNCSRGWVSHEFCRPKPKQ